MESSKQIIDTNKFTCLYHNPCNGCKHFSQYEKPMMIHSKISSSLNKTIIGNCQKYEYKYVYAREIPLCVIWSYEQ